MQKDPTTKRKKKESAGEDEEVVLGSYPDIFTSHIDQAQQWYRMVMSSEKVSQVEEADRNCSIFEHPKFGDIMYQTFTKDVRELHDYMPRRPYTLILADIPYGFDMAGCLHNDKVCWGESELGTMIRAAKVVTNARAWRVIIIHSTPQIPVVKKVLEQECNSGIQECIW